MLNVMFIKLNTPWIVDQYSDPPLGILSVIASSKNISFKGKPLELRLLDMAHEQKIPKSDFYAISACTPNYPELLRVAQEIKNLFNAPIGVGGPHFDALSIEELSKEMPRLPADIIFRGEGEATFGKGIEYLESESGKLPQKIITQSGPLLNFDKLPIPAREFLDKKYYFKPGTVFFGDSTKRGNSATMMTSRGCPFNCSFCASPKLHQRKVRYRSVENVRKEIELLQKEYDVTDIRFQDDCFTLNKGRFAGLAAMLKNTGISYRASMRADQVDDETLSLLWDSGCREMGLGIESAEDNVLKLIKKRTTVEQNKCAIYKLKERNFKARVFIMTGLPGETRDSSKHMIDFLEQTKPDVVTLTSFMPLPGTDIYEQPERYGITITDKDWGKYDQALKREAGATFVHRLSTATMEEMEENRELLKKYIFNKKISNVLKYNLPYSKEVK